MTKILVVESDEPSKDAIMSCINTLRYDAICVPNGKLAKDILKYNTDFKLAIVGTTPTDTNSRKFVKSLREDSKFSNLPIIITSGKIALHDIDEFLSLGAAYFSPKPINSPELAKYIRKILESHGG